MDSNDEDEDEDDEDINCFGMIALLRTYCLLGRSKACDEVASSIMDFLLYTILFPTSSSSRDLSEDSRREAMNLIEMLCSHSSVRLEVFLKCVKPLIEKITPPDSSWSWSPTLESRSESGFVGIKNPGCVCYMNSMNQQLFMLSSFRDSILMLDAESMMNRKGEGKQEEEEKKALVEKKDNFLFQLQKMFLNLRYSKRKAYDSREWCFAFKDRSNKHPTNVLIQEDTNEYLNLLMSRVEDVCKGMLFVFFLSLSILSLSLFLFLLTLTLPPQVHPQLVRKKRAGVAFSNEAYKVRTFSK